MNEKEICAELYDFDEFLVSHFWVWFFLQQKKERERENEWERNVKGATKEILKKRIKVRAAFRKKVLVKKQ